MRISSISSAEAILSVFGIGCEGCISVSLSCPISGRSFRAGAFSATLAVVASSLLIVALPARAQVDFAGLWDDVTNMDKEPRDPYPGEYGGIPLNDAGQMRANTWSASMQTLPVWQCRPHPIGYWARSPHSILIQREINPTTRALVAYHVQMGESIQASIYLDGRPHPSDDALHTWNGFSTGEWLGNTLKFRTTHLKESYLLRNGVTYSDETTMTQYWMRRDGVLSWVQIFHDPVYLEEPFVRVSEFVYDPTISFDNDECVVADLIGRPRGAVPHYLPGENPSLREYSEKFESPFEANQGGAETMYPEYRERLRELGGVRVPNNPFPD